MAAMNDNGISLNHDNYATFYKRVQNGGNESDEKIFKLIKYCLLNGKKINLLNVGVGTAENAKEFLDHMLPFCDKIILNEINPTFCQKYRESDWYNQYKSKIIVLEGSIQSILEQKGKNENNIFDGIPIDLIWCNHVLYHVRINEIDYLIRKFSEILTNDPNSGYIFIGCEDDDEYLIKKLFLPIAPNYRLCSEIKSVLKKNKMKYTEIVDQIYVDFSDKKEAIDLWKLFVVEDLYKNPDYKPSLPLTKNEEIMLEANISSHLDNVLIRNEDKYIWKQNTRFFVIRKRMFSNL